MKVLVGAFNQEKALVGAFSVIVQLVVEPMEHYTAPIRAAAPPAEVLHRVCLMPRLSIISGKCFQLELKMKLP